MYVGGDGKLLKFLFKFARLQVLVRSKKMQNKVDEFVTKNFKNIKNSHSKYKFGNALKNAVVTIKKWEKWENQPKCKFCSKEEFG